MHSETVTKELRESETWTNCIVTPLAYQHQECDQSLTQEMQYCHDS